MSEWKDNIIDFYDGTTYGRASKHVEACQTCREEGLTSEVVYNHPELMHVHESERRRKAQTLHYVSQGIRSREPRDLAKEAGEHVTQKFRNSRDPEMPLTVHHVFIPEMEVKAKTEITAESTLRTMWKMHREGMSMRAIAAATGVSKSTVARRLETTDEAPTSF